MIKKLIEKIFRISFQYRNQELPAFLLHNIYHGGPYLPYTISTLKFRGMACILNDIVINSRLSILEFGSGISTILMARLAKLNGIPLHIYSVDQNEGWIQYLLEITRKEGLTAYVHFIHAPLVKSAEHETAYEFDKKAVSSALEKLKFDLVLIDGPTASRKSNKMSRVTNYHYLQYHLSDKASIFIDNTDREGEKMLVDKVKKELQLKETRVDDSFSIFVRGDHFNFRI